ncbi:MAG TPA: hypothetical protein PLR56_04840, partial [Brevefilum sp.]|nr:hypothetical protein [Brevefilum sp.]
MVGDHRHDALAGFVDLPLGKAQELDVIILQPFWIFLTQRFAVHRVIALRAVNIGFQQLLRPCILVRRNAGIGRVAHDHQDRLALYLARQPAFHAQRADPGNADLLDLLHLQRVG